MCLSSVFGGGNSSNKEAKIARAEEQARQGRITQGTGAINDTFNSQFNDDFFKGLQNNYVNYATPQLEQQNNEAAKQLTYALARTGNLDSSARASQEATQQQTYDLGKQQIADQGLSYGTTARNSVESSRSNLIAALNATGDNSQAANSAISQASVLSAKPAYSPIGQLFSATTGGLAAQAAAEKATGLAGGYTPSNTTYQSSFNTGLFGNNGSVKVRA